MPHSIQRRQLQPGVKHVFGAGNPFNRRLLTPRDGFAGSHRWCEPPFHKGAKRLQSGNRFFLQGFDPIVDNFVIGRACPKAKTGLRN